MKFFEEEDFKNLWIGLIVPPLTMANTANKLLEERGIKVHGGFDGDQFIVKSPTLGVHPRHGDPDTHQALLVCIEEIQKECTSHEPVLFDQRMLFVNPTNSYLCGHCGKNIKPKWELL